MYAPALASLDIYCKWGKIRWAKVLRFLQFFSLPQKFSHEFLSNKHWRPMHRENISVKNFIGLKSRIFSPANLSMSIVAI